MTNTHVFRKVQFMAFNPLSIEILKSIQMMEPTAGSILITPENILDRILRERQWHDQWLKTQTTKLPGIFNVVSWVHSQFNALDVCKVFESLIDLKEKELVRQDFRLGIMRDNIVPPETILGDTTKYSLTERGQQFLSEVLQKNPPSPAFAA